MLNNISRAFYNFSVARDMFASFALAINKLVSVK